MLFNERELLRYCSAMPPDPSVHTIRATHLLQHMAFPLIQVPSIAKRLLGKSRVPQPDSQSSASSSFWEVTEKHADEARAKGHALRSFFPHQFYVLPKCGPDGLKQAQRMCGVDDPNQCWEIVLYACPSYAKEFPEKLFLDNELVWHQQHFDKPWQVATANLLVHEQRLYALFHLSDIVQRISRRREYKTRIENRLKGWHLMLLNSIGNFAIQHNLFQIYSPTSRLAMKYTDLTRTVQPELFERVYDRDIHKLFTAQREGDWWVIDVKENQPRIVLAQKNSQVMTREKTICVFHDIERGLGHLTVAPSFAEEAEQQAPGHLLNMLSIEQPLGVQATYNVVGLLLNEVRGSIEKAGHCLAFHSYDHKLDDTSPQYLYQAAKCRQVDYRLKGYRTPQSRMTPELIPRILCKHNYEWLASSAYSLKLKEPMLKDRLVYIPILFDDFDLYMGRLSYAEWEAKALGLIEQHHFVAFGLHDCYAHLWLPHYKDFLQKIGEMGHFRTLDQTANAIFLAHSV